MKHVMKTMLIIFLIFFTTVFANSYEKYIELLSNEEKQDFFDKVARRIADNDNSKDTKDIFSRELNDEELKLHDVFVKAVMKQESDRIKNRHAAENNDSKEVSDDNLKVKPLRKSKNEVEIETTDITQIIPLGKRPNRRSMDGSFESVTTTSSYLHKRSVPTEVSYNNTEINHPENRDTNQNKTIQVTESPINNSNSQTIQFDTDTTIIKLNLTTHKSTTTSTTPKPPTIESKTKNFGESSSKESKEKYSDSKSEERVVPLATQENNATINNKTINNTTNKTSALNKDSNASLEYEANKNETNPQKSKDTEENHGFKETNEVLLDKNSKNNTKSDDNKVNEDNNTTIKPDSKETIKNTTISLKQDIKTANDSDISTSTEKINLTTGLTGSTDSGEVADEESVEDSPENYKPRAFNDVQNSSTSTVKYETDVPKLTTTASPVEKQINNKLNKNSNEEKLTNNKLTENSPKEIQTDNKLNENGPEEKQPNNKLNENIVKKELKSTTTEKPMYKAVTKFFTTTTVKNTVPPLKKPNKKSKTAELVSKVLNKINDDVKNEAKVSETKKEKAVNTSKTKEKENKVEKKQNIIPNYQVYEVPWSSSKEFKPFLRSKDPIIDEPYFVPVYNYSPNKAYYNPENRLGPNEIDIIDKEYDLLRKGDENNNIKNTNSAFLKDLFYAIRKFGLLQTTTTTETPKYIFKKGPKIKPQNMKSGEFYLPDSDEDMHPLNTMKNELKTHLHAIRQILFKNHRYDFPKCDKNIVVPPQCPIKTTTQTPVTDSKTVEKEVRNAHEPTVTVLERFNHVQYNEKSNKPVRVRVWDQLIDYGRMGDNQRSSDENGAEKAFEVDNLQPNMELLQNLSLKLMRRNSMEVVDLYTYLLKDMIKKDNKALKQYDWLLTTVKIQAGLKKMRDLIDRVRNHKTIHPKDMQLLKYIQFVVSFTSNIRNSRGLRRNLNTKTLKKKQGTTKSQAKIKRLSSYLRKMVPSLEATDNLTNLTNFLNEIEDGLHDLHTAVKNIANISSYRNQNWYKNLKDLYLTTENKEISEILLHVTMSKLIMSLEKSCELASEGGFVKFMKENRKLAKRTLEEALFLQNILFKMRNNK